MKLFINHRGCHGLQIFQIGRWTCAFWIVPRSVKLAPHYHPDQEVHIFPLLCIRTTFNRCPDGKYPEGVETFRARFLRRCLTPDGYFHFANKSDPNRSRFGPFIFFNLIKWLDGNPKHPKYGYELATIPT